MTDNVVRMRATPSVREIVRAMEGVMKVRGERPFEIGPKEANVVIGALRASGLA